MSSSTASPRRMAPGRRGDAAGDGLEAIAKIGAFDYDLVFMDCEMPEMDGCETTTRIRREHTGRRHVPVVAMTAKAIAGDRERCLHAGASDYIAKPVDAHQLLSLLRVWMHR